MGQKVEQSAELGFIKFGSRVDVLLPAGTKVEVQLNQNVKGGVHDFASYNISFISLRLSDDIGSAL